MDDSCFTKWRSWYTSQRSVIALWIYVFWALWVQLPLSFLSCWHICSQDTHTWQEPGGHTLASWFSEWNFLHSGSVIWKKSLSLRAQKSKRAHPECSREEWYSHHPCPGGGGRVGTEGPPWRERSPWEGLFPGCSMKAVDYFDGNSSSMSSKRSFCSHAFSNSTSHCLPPPPCFRTVQNKNLLGKIITLSYLVI